MSIPLRSRLLQSLPTLLLCLGLGEASAATFTVTLTEDGRDGVCDSHCTLRDAIDAANATPGSHQIVLPAGEYLLQLPSADEEDEDDNQRDDLDVTGQIRITGAGHERTIIRAAQTGHRLFEVHPGASLRLEQLALRDGWTPFNGGAVENHGHLELHKVWLARNVARTPRDLWMSEETGWTRGQGGAVANYGEMRVSWSYFQRNSALGGDYNHPGRGGAIFNRGALVVRDTRLQENFASSEDDRGAGGGVYNRGTADIERSHLVTNDGGSYVWGVAITNVLGGQLRLVNSTIALTNGYSYPALQNGDPNLQDNQSDTQAYLAHVTIAFNLGGIGNRGRMKVHNSIVLGNADLFNANRDCTSQGPGALMVTSGLLLNPTNGNCPADHFNYEHDPDELYGTVFLRLTGRTMIDALALPPGSPAIDAGVGNCSSHDAQRAPRPQDGDGDGVVHCDLGAYERGTRPAQPEVPGFPEPSIPAQAQ